MLAAAVAFATDGSQLWLQYDAPAPEATPELTARAELRAAGLGDPTVIVSDTFAALRPGGFIIAGDTIKASSGIGALYGAFHMIRRGGEGTFNPAYQLRALNHWDNLDGTIERGYAGSSIWLWDELPDSVSPRYRQYARANASIGINATVLNNVNASPAILSHDYLVKVAAIAGQLRPYGIRTFLAVNFASPMVLDSLPTADPLDPAVIAWWQAKADEIYALIPDFGGFLVKANSEGQPGPCDFGRTHAEGANMLAQALAAHGGTVMWRAFVYSPSDADRAKQAYLEFQPLDGQFDPNVIVQIKNGPIDFQPREPYSPLFDGMHSTARMVEFQITQEYLGQSNHMAYLAPMWSEFFNSVEPSSLQAIAGVSNIGDSANWTAHPLAQANWYAFGRLAWDPGLSPETIVREWLAQTFGNDPRGVAEMMLASREAVVDYMMPLGLHHIFAFGHHYGPEPWCEIEGARPDWLPPYYHRADSIGLGFDRSASGSDAAAQYREPWASAFGDINRCPEELLLWFHHVPWDHRMRSGMTLWDELCHRYQRGLEAVAGFRRTWDEARQSIDPKTHADVAARLATQEKDARWWRDACLLYFGQFSGMPLPDGIQPNHTLEELKAVDLGISNFECPSPELLDSLR